MFVSRVFCCVLQDKSNFLEKPNIYLIKAQLAGDILNLEFIYHPVGFHRTI